MGKLAQTTIKYNIFARFDAEGMIEKPDVIGAIFGQTEGLLGPEMDLRELQKTGRVGRIEVQIEDHNGKACGIITIPSSLDSSETALLAACIETIERVGPCNAKISIDRVEDVRIVKRRYIVERAKELLNKIYEEGVSDIQEVSEQIKEAVRTSEIREWKGMPAGPDIESYDNIIIVEGRADVINLLRAGIKNVIAIEGTSISPLIGQLTQEKSTTVFLDGDRGGDLILKELSSIAEIDYVARAPSGKEVEELTKKEIFKALRDKVPFGATKIEQTKSSEPIHEQRRSEPPKVVVRTILSSKRPVKKEEERGIKSQFTAKFKETLEGLIGTRAACFLNSHGEILGRIPAKEMTNAMNEIEAEAIVFDGIIDQKIVNAATSKGIKYVVGMDAERVKPTTSVTILTLKELR